MLIPPNISALTGAQLLPLFVDGANEDLLMDNLTKSQIEQIVKLAPTRLLHKLRLRTFDRSEFDQILIKRFFITPSFQMYGGIAGLFDYGPPGCSLQANILALWRTHFCLEEEMLEIECTNLTPESVLKTSGHVERFADYMVKDLKTGDIFRADHLIKQILQLRIEGVFLNSKVKTPVDAVTRKNYELILETLDDYQETELAKLIVDLSIQSPAGNPISPPMLFNLMFATQIGPTGQFQAYLRPETAQGHFLNFKKLLEFNGGQMPFASASIGKSFRNEISPRQGLLRVREFTMAEIEHFCDPLNKDHPKFSTVSQISLPLYSRQAQLEQRGAQSVKLETAVKTGLINNETLAYFLARIYSFVQKLGIIPELVRFRQHLPNEMAHYAQDCWDLEIKSSYGWIESVGCADRSAYDLTAHANKTGEKLVVRQVLDQSYEEIKLAATLNNKEIGLKFKQTLKSIKSFFEIANQTELLRIKNEIEINSKIELEFDNEMLEITHLMVKIDMKTTKVNGNFLLMKVREYVPNVIEPSFGIGRIFYAVLEHCYYTRKEDSKRAVFKFPVIMAPTKTCVIPISNAASLSGYVTNISTLLRKSGIASKTDASSQSIFE
jgi:glycyl-tRNA synthetase